MIASHIKVEVMIIGIDVSKRSFDGAWVAESQVRRQVFTIPVQLCGCIVTFHPLQGA